ncbi:MAG: hypothetical protein ABEJ00_02100, partial [Gemmatimonadota bacterium]
AGGTYPMNGKHAVEVVIAAISNTLVWIASSEQIWFSIVGGIQFMKPVLGLPDLRGPLAFVTIIYVGLRAADWLNARKKLDENLS